MEPEKRIPNQDTAGTLFRKLALPLAALVLAALGFFLVGVYWDYALANNRFFSFPVGGGVGVDVYGALIPLAAALASAIAYFALKFSAWRFALTLAISTALAFAMFRMTVDGLLGRPLVYALAAGSVAAVLAFTAKPLLDSKRKSAVSFLAALSCTAFSLLVLDLAYAPSFVGAVIGGNGLADAVLVSTLYAPFWAAIVAAVASMLIQTAVFLKNYNPKSKQPA